MSQFTRAVVPDFETRSTVNLKKAGAWVYAESPTTEILSLSYNVDYGAALTLTPAELTYDPESELADLANDPSVIFIAHNAGFEKAIWRFIMVVVFGWPDIPNERWHDTAAAAAEHGLPMKLDTLAKVLKLANQKWMEGSKLTMAMSKPISRGKRKGYFDNDPAKLEVVYKYNREDVLAQTGVHQRIGWQTPSERRVWLLDQKINERGIRLDLDYIRNAQKIVDEASVPRLQEFDKITGGLKVTQRDQIMKWVMGEGVKLPNLKKETLTALLGAEDEATEDELGLSGSDPDTEDEARAAVAGIILPEHVRRALEIRQVLGSASVKKLRAMSASVASDGRVHGAAQYYGAISTGRWAGRLFQPQNFPRGVLKLGKGAMPVDAVVSAIQTGDWKYVSLLGDPIDAVVSGLRHAIIPADGHALVVGDYAGIEARIVLALAGQHDKTALMASGADVYLDMARTIYGREIVKSETKERQVGKNSVLGAGFQMGWRKFKARYSPEMSDEEARDVIDAYRKEWAPKVPKLWYGLEEAALKAVKDGRAYEAFGVEYRLEREWLTARLPSGRKLWYYGPKLIKKAMPWNPDIVKEAWSYRAFKMGRMITVDAYGGLLAENAVQGLARDLLAGSMFRLEKEGFPLVLTVHDEDVSDVEQSRADYKVLEQIMEDVEPWARAIQVPIKAEGWQGGRYRK